MDTELARWLSNLAELATFRAEHGHGNVPSQYRTAGGTWLGDWLRRCRDAHRATRTRHSPTYPGVWVRSPACARGDPRRQSSLYTRPAASRPVTRRR
ncbi:helicase associated domain-containing protein [Nocardia sp. NPDC051750]|uniref:helicase associated domain-containing protein n=1 Tax=Nocardia sp. NPDC051750 TaxID=3364325 RepID=UPI0037A359C0